MLRCIYFSNFSTFLWCLVTVTLNQINGEYFAETVDVKFGDTVWRKAIIKDGDGNFVERLLLFSYFNGLYERVHGENHHGHPIYREVRKVQPHSKYEVKVPAEYKYCKGEEAWVFTHPDIYKTIEGSRDSKDCNWLARSPTPDDFDLLGIQGHWDLWTGAISKGDVSIDDGRCKDDQSCNLNGKCEGGKCVCAVRENVSRRCSEYFLCTN